MVKFTNSDKLDNMVNEFMFHNCCLFEVRRDSITQYTYQDVAISLEELYFYDGDSGISYTNYIQVTENKFTENFTTLFYLNYLFLQLKVAYPQDKFILKSISDSCFEVVKQCNTLNKNEIMI